MADIGQAQANAELVRDLLGSLDLESDSKILFAGAGPGQMFDYVDGKDLSPLNLTFTDISEHFLEKVSERARSAGLTKFRAVLDDVEAPKVNGPFHVVVLVLVLEHVDWKKALGALSRLGVERFLIVIQNNPPEVSTNVSPNRPLRGSLQEASEGEKAHLIPSDELVREMEQLGYRVERSDNRDVLDGKTMCGFLFARS
jgi:hypothetical protein